MNYKEYQNSRDLAWLVLLNEGVRELPVRVGALCKGMGISVHYYTPKDQNDGYSTIMGDRAHIFVSDQCPIGRQRFTVAHELGHILMGHVGQYQLVNREPGPTDNWIEQSANVFASRLLAPACVLWALDARTPEEIAELCGISYRAAEIRAKRMEILYKRQAFLQSQLERQVYQQFEEFIRNRKL